MNLSKQHLEILEYSDSLFARWNLRKNTYLFKHIKSNLEIPLFIFAQERRIAQITQAQVILIEALKLSEFVDINQETRMIKIIQLPALRFQDQAHLLKTEGIVKNWIKQKSESKINMSKPLQYIISNKTDDGWYYFILKSKTVNKTILKELVCKYNSEHEQKIKYNEEPMYEDIKNGVNRQRKMKRQMLQKDGGHRNYQNNYNQTEAQLKVPTYSRQNMGMMYPGLYYNGYNYQNMGMTPQQMYMNKGQSEAKFQKVFIRRAVESSDEDIVKQQTPINQPTISQQLKIENSSTNVHNSPSKLANESTQKKQETKNVKNKKQENNKKQKQEKQEKQPKNKVVLDDSDFPSIG